MTRASALRALTGALLLGLSACQPTVQSYNAAVQEPALIEDQFLAVDMAALPVKRWLPKASPKAILVALHGFNDYANAFDAPGTYFAQHGIATYAYDQRGFGGAPQRGIWAGQANLTRDAADMVRALHKQQPGVPIYLLGESMGGAVVISLLAEKPALPLSGAILSAAALWPRSSMNWLYQGTLWMGAHTIPWYKVTGRGLKIMASDNVPMLIALGKDPQVLKETRLDAIYGLVDLMDNAHARIDAIEVPLLALYGANDQIIPPQPVQESFLRIKAPHRVAYYPEGYHMLMRDLQGQVVQQDIVSWVLDAAKPLPSGFDAGWKDRFKKP